VNACPKEDGDYQPKDAMDIDEGASLRKGKGKARAAELEEREWSARGVRGTRVPLLGGSCADQEVEGSGCPQGTSQSHARRSGMQGVLRQEAEMLPA